MGLERIVIASAATAAKYLASGMEGVSPTPYPLVHGNDAYGRDIVVPLTLRGSNDQLSFKEAVVNVRRSRNIVATPVLNGRGTVKEMITEGDLDLTITLAVVSNTEAGDYLDNLVVSYDTYPYNGVESLRKLLDEPERLAVVSDFLKLFGLDGGDSGIVVKSYSVHQDTHLNRQVFEIQAVSDYDYELLIGE